MAELLKLTGRIVALTEILFCFSCWVVSICILVHTHEVHDSTDSSDTDLSVAKMFGYQKMIWAKESNLSGSRMGTILNFLFWSVLLGLGIAVLVAAMDIFNSLIGLIITGFWMAFNIAILVMNCIAFNKSLEYNERNKKTEFLTQDGKLINLIDNYSIIVAVSRAVFGVLMVPLVMALVKSLSSSSTATN